MRRNSRPGGLLLAPDGSLDKMALQGPPDDLAAGKLVFRAVAVEREEFAAGQPDGDFRRRGVVGCRGRSRFIVWAAFSPTTALRFRASGLRRAKCGQFKGRVPKICGVFSSVKVVVSA
jgi:hypothetical protein